MPPSQQLDEFEQAELDARHQAALDGYSLGQPPTPEVLARLSVVE